MSRPPVPKAFRSLTRWLLLGLAVEVPVLVVGAVVLIVLYRAEVLTRTSLQVWLFAFLAVVLVAGIVYQFTGIRRYARELKATSPEAPEAESKR